MDETPRVTVIAARSATADWTGPIQSGVGTITVPSGVLSSASVTYPSRVGEPEGHTSPEELIAAAHAGCFAMSVSGALTMAAIQYARITVTATLTVGRSAGVMRFTAADLAVTVVASPSNSESIRAAVADADTRCPVSNALRATLPVTISVVVGDEV